MPDRCALCGAVFALAWNPRGTQLAAGGSSCKLLIVDALTGAVEREVAQGGTVWSIAWDPGGTRVCVGSSDGPRGELRVSTADGSAATPRYSTRTAIGGGRDRQDQTVLMPRWCFSARSSRHVFGGLCGLWWLGLRFFCIPGTQRHVFRFLPLLAYRLWTLQF